MLSNQKIWIYEGKISFLVENDWREYQVFQNGNPISFSYRGEAYVGRAKYDGENLVRIQQGCNLIDFTYSPQPTPESDAYNQGFHHAINQKRRNDKKAMSGWDSKNCEWKSVMAERFHAGWVDGWKEKTAA